MQRNANQTFWQTFMGTAEKGTVYVPDGNGGVRTGGSNDASYLGKDAYGYNMWLNSGVTNNDGAGGIAYRDPNSDDYMATLLGQGVNSGEEFGTAEAAYLYGYGSAITSNALSFMGTKAGRLMSMGGSYVFRSSTYAAQRALVAEAAMAGKYIKAGGSILAFAGIAITGYDMVINGNYSTSNKLDLVFGAAGFIPGVGWAISGAYFIGNAVLISVTGKSIGDTMDYYSNYEALHTCPVRGIGDLN